MNRRVLLIDSDTGFRDTLTRLLGRYKVEVHVEANPDAALPAAVADAPDAVLIAVEEPEKQGFKTFQKARKQLAAKIPIALVTASMAADSFAKHRSMKVHADEYIDKREVDDDALVAKLDSLLGLGEPQDDDLPIGEDMPMEIADGDVVLDEEQVEEDRHGGFENDMATVNPSSGVLVDRMVAQETDAAFDALLGDDMFGGGGGGGDEPAAAADAAPDLPIDEPPQAIPEAAADDSAIPEPVPHKIPDLDPPPENNSDFDMDSVPSAIQDGGLQSDSFVSVVSVVNAAQIETAPEDALEPGSDHGDDGGGDGATVIGDEAAASDDQDDFAEEELAPPGGRDSLSSIPLVDDDLVSLDDELPVEVDDELPAEEAPMEEASEPVAAAPEPVAAAPAPRSASHPVVDLGLDDIAENAEREQSGLYDRKSMRKIGELERQVTQLKTELERARAAADTSAKGGRENQFLNLREQNLAKDKELKQVKTALEQHEKDLAEAQEKLRQAQHAKAALEAKNTQLEDRLFNEGGKEKELAASLEEVSARAAQLEQELAAKSKSAMAAETALAQLERDLATERASRAATASESERTLRLEREQLILRHKGELAAARAEAEGAQEFALSRLREELEAARASAVEDAIEEVRRANAAEHAEAIEAEQQKHHAELVALKTEQAGEIGQVKRELGARIEELQATLAEAKGAQAAALDELEAAAAEATRAQAAAVAGAEQQHAQALEQMKQRYEAELEARAEEQEEARQRDADSHGQVLSELKQQLDRTTVDAKQQIERANAEANQQVERARAEATEQLEHATAAYEAKLATAQQALADLRAQAEAEQQGLAGQHQAALAEQQQHYEAQLAQVADGAKRAADSHRAQLAELQQQHEAQLAETTEAAQRESAEQRAQLQAAKRAAEEAAARYEAEREEMQQAHASRIGEIEDKAERTLAIANGEHQKATAVADAEHGKEINTLRAEADRKLQQLEQEHARKLGELNGELDELRKGLSGARDSLKRSEGELASAVQTIADRNADLRAHAAGLAERDQRIADLRKEIESLEQENASYQEQVLRAYQKIKADEAMVARARKAMAIALTVLDDQGNPTTSS